MMELICAKMAGRATTNNSERSIMKLPGVWKNMIYFSKKCACVYI